MKCPNCNYEHNWNGDKQKIVTGKKGGFFQTSDIFVMKRDICYGEETRTLYGCRNCNKLFMDF